MLRAMHGVRHEFWSGKRVFLTGHTGFKGAWLTLWLTGMGAHVTGFALAPKTRPSLWRLTGSDAVRSMLGDIRDESSLGAALAEASPQIVIHMAAQALVKESYRDPVGTYATNVMGTLNVLQACRAQPQVECIVIVTSDKVYENHGEGRAFVETDRLGGHDPYSNSKACADILTSSFRESFLPDGPPVATARAGNVIGGGDWSQDRLIPDCVRALLAGQPVKLRYPDAVRPWQHVLEPLSGYLALAQMMVQLPNDVPRAVNFGPGPGSFCTVREVVEAFSARFAGKPGWCRDESRHAPEAHALTLSSVLAERALHWQPSLRIDESLSWTADWYRAHAAGQDIRAVCETQISQYQTLAQHSA